MLAKSFARIHWQNLANFGVLALEFARPADYDRIAQGDQLRLRAALTDHGDLRVHNVTRNEDYEVTHHLSPRQRSAVLAGGVIPALGGG